MTDVQNSTEEEDWTVVCSDDEKYDITKEDMKELFERVAKKEPFVLNWKCPGRRSPTPERDVQNVEIKEEMEQDFDMQPQVAGEFDFNETSSELNSVAPRKAPVSTKPSRSKQKRVARFDKIMDDMMRHQKMHEEAARTLGENK